MLLFSDLTIRAVFFTVLVLGMISASISQNTSSYYGLVGIGNLAPHKSTVRHLQQNPSFKVELGWNLELNSANCHLEYRKPIIGIMVQFANSGNKKLIGNTMSVSTYGLLPLYSHELPLYFGAGYGIGYIQKPFDLITNPTNNAIGSHFNANILVMLQKEFKILEDNKLITKIGISHFSNATVHMPNLGLNYIYVSVGYKIEYPILVNYLNYRPLNIYYLWNTSFSGIIGVKENEQPLGGSYGIYGVSIQEEYRRRFKSSWIASLDIILNNAIKQISGNSFQPGVHLAYFLNFDKLRLGIGLGTYLLNAPKVGRTYNKVTVEHRLGKKLNLQLQLKSHWAAADFITAGIVYSLR